MIPQLPLTDAELAFIAALKPFRHRDRVVTQMMNAPSHRARDVIMAMFSWAAKK